MRWYQKSYLSKSCYWIIGETSRGVYGVQEASKRHS